MKSPKAQKYIKIPRKNFTIKPGLPLLVDEAFFFKYPYAGAKTLTTTCMTASLDSSTGTTTSSPLVNSHIMEKPTRWTVGKGLLQPVKVTKGAKFRI